MSNPLSSVLATIPGATVEVRQAGELLGRVSRDAVAELTQRGWAIARGVRVVKYLELLPGAPWQPSSRTWRGGSHTTRRIRNDQGVIIGDRLSGLEHKPLLREF